PEVAGDLAGVRTIVVVGTDHDDVDVPCDVVHEAAFLDGVAPADDLPAPLPSDICAMLYTSGTTGNSKGVLMPWAQLYSQAVGFPRMKDLEEDEAWYMPYPMNHVGGKTPVYTMVVLNGRVVIRDGFDTGAFWKDIDDYGCTSTAFLGGTASFV